jgi:hypothetical protein
MRTLGFSRLPCTLPFDHLGLNSRVLAGISE